MTIDELKLKPGLNVFVPWREVSRRALYSAMEFFFPIKVDTQLRHLDGNLDHLHPKDQDNELIKLRREGCPVILVTQSAGLLHFCSPEEVCEVILTPGGYDFRWVAENGHALAWAEDFTPGSAFVAGMFGWSPADLINT